MAPKTVRMVLVEGKRAGGVTLDEDNFELPRGLTASAVADQVVTAILGTQESAAERGHQLQSSGVTWTDAVDAEALRAAIAAHKIENVMLVSTLMAAAALARAVGNATNCARTALLFVEPNTATLAVVDSADGSIVDVQRQTLPRGGNAEIARLTALISTAASMDARPDGILLVGSGVDIPRIKLALEGTTSLSIATLEEPETALARGAALASANAHLAAPSTIVLPPLSALVEAESGEFAYSAVSDDDDAGFYREPARQPAKRRPRTAELALISAVVICVGGAVALAVALALDIRPTVEQRPSISKNVVAPVNQAPPLKEEAPAPPPLSAVPGPPSAVPAPPSAPPPEAPSPVVPQQGPLQRWGEQRHDRGWFHRHFG